MEVITDLHVCPVVDRGTVVTIGFYDGVHRGHQALIGRVRELAAERGCATAVATFDRHPAMIVRPSSAPKLLTDLDQRIELLGESGIDYCVVIHFDEKRVGRARGGVRDRGARRLPGGARGRGGGGLPLRPRPRWRRCAAPAARRYPWLRRGALRAGRGAGLDAPVSSTAIRKLLVAGEVEAATELLGRPHEVRGTVERGDGRGRELGFPTANVAVPAEILLPADGIYAGWYERPSGRSTPTAISLGRRPTFYADAEASLLEAHLLDFDDDLYGERAGVRFVRRLRGEERFESVEALVDQMGRDVAAARRALGE